MFKYYRYKATVTPSSGSVTWATPKLVGEIKSYHIKPATATTVYNFSIVDPDGLVIDESSAPLTGELTSLSNNIVINEILTCTISGATADEVFTVVIRVMVDGLNR
jgi:hypothetical protein